MSTDMKIPRKLKKKLKTLILRNGLNSVWRRKDVRIDHIEPSFSPDRLSVWRRKGVPCFGTKLVTSYRIGL